MLTTLKWQWKLIRMNQNKLEVQEIADEVDIAQVWNPPPRKVHPDTSRHYPQPNILSSRAPEFIWNQVRSYNLCFSIAILLKAMAFLGFMPNT